jgi:hypothetical protein
MDLMTLKKIRSFIIVFVAITAILPAPLQGATGSLQVYAAPGHPLTLTTQSNDGVIKEAWLRSPAGLHPLKVLEGKRITENTWHLPFADKDLRPDLIWRLSFNDPETTKKYYLWVTALTETPRAWLAVTPAGPSRWDTLPLNISTPPDVFLYVSPNLPAYIDISSTKRESESLLSFIYTVGLTMDGPNFVLIPEVYRQLQPVAELVQKAEEDETIKNAYGKLQEDFDKMGKGQAPSREAIINFCWKKILNINWQD